MCHFNKDRRVQIFPRAAEPQVVPQVEKFYPLNNDKSTRYIQPNVEVPPQLVHYIGMYLPK